MRSAANWHTARLRTRVLSISIVIGAILGGSPLRAQEAFPHQGDLWETLTEGGELQGAGNRLRIRTESPSKKAAGLVRLDDHLYQNEHALFIIDTVHIEWPDYQSVYSFDNVNYYFDTFFEHFSGEFTTIVVAANNLEPNYTPNYFSSARKAYGIGDDLHNRDFDFCRYNVGGGPSSSVDLSVFDHEIGHGWGAYLPPSHEGHWIRHSTIFGQMAEVYIPRAATVNYIVGDEADGFRWKSIWNQTRNERQVYSLQQLYVMGLHPRYPDTYRLHDPVYHPDSSVSYSSLDKYDHSSITTEFGERTPDYRTATKRFRLGFIYVGRNYREIAGAATAFERSIKHFTYAEDVDLDHFLYEVPFLVLTRFRGSVDSRLSDLDGNAAPTLEIVDSYASVSKGGTAALRFEAGDRDGTPPTLSCLTYAEQCSFDRDVLHVGPMDSTGAHFITVKAVDAGGKTVFAHAVVDVLNAPTHAEVPSGGEFEGFALLPNHPNPVRTSTTFTIELPQRAFVTLNVYDLLGREIDAVVSEDLPPGRFQRTWTPTVRASGMYLYRLRAGGYSEARLMTVRR